MRRYSAPRTQHADGHLRPHGLAQGPPGRPPPAHGQGLHQDQPPPGLALVPVRDSKAADGPALCFEAASWAAFIGALKGQ
ncbi:DUF397 domain-containing protein [Streptomyces sp. NPDC059374]|uniref:DUF397 domain-containing protein n=1 Tax=Streptomyces sp. NPDC059374 TaxID=3346814 RepID=UPI0036931812